MSEVATVTKGGGAYRRWWKGLLYHCTTIASITREDLVDVEIQSSCEICENKKSEQSQSESKVSDKPVSPYLPQLMNISMKINRIS